jgi:hypothetical protein
MGRLDGTGCSVSTMREPGAGIRVGEGRRASRSWAATRAQCAASRERPERGPGFLGLAQERQPLVTLKASFKPSRPGPTGNDGRPVVDVILGHQPENPLQLALFDLLVEPPYQRLVSSIDIAAVLPRLQSTTGAGGRTFSRATAPQ